MEPSIALWIPVMAAMQLENRTKPWHVKVQCKRCLNVLGAQRTSLCLEDKENNYLEPMSVSI